MTDKTNDALVIAQKNDAIAQQNDIIAKQNEIIARKNGIIASENDNFELFKTIVALRESGLKDAIEEVRLMQTFLDDDEKRVAQIAIAKRMAAANMVEQNNMAHLLLREQEQEQEEDEIRCLEQALVAVQLRDNADQET
jgi:hypothetical protein